MARSCNAGRCTVIGVDGDVDDVISQLSLTYKFIPNGELDEIGIENCWSDGSRLFRDFIQFATLLW